MPASNPNIQVGGQISKSKLDSYSKIISKAVRSSDENKNRKIDNLEHFSSLNISNQVSTIVDKNKQLLELFPDIEIAMDIKTSSIISPNDLMANEIKIRLKDSGASTKVTSPISNIVESYMSNKIDLKTIITESMFTKGAWITAIIPEPLLDKIIEKNIVATESDVDTSRLKKSKKKQQQQEEYTLGCFKKSKDISGIAALESDLNIKITNPTDTKGDSLLKLFKLDTDDLVSDNIFKIKTISAALESSSSNIKNKLKLFKTPKKKLTQEDINKAFSTVKREREEFMALPAVKASENKGESLEIKLPVSSCIPIYPTGEPNKHIGYFILINPLTGTPIQEDEYSRRLGGYNNAYSNNTQVQGDVFTSVINAIKGNPGVAENKEISIRNVDTIYNKLLDLKIKSVLKDSVFDDIVEIDISTNEAYRVMLSRVLEAKDTKMIFIPKELVSYVAFDYRENGTGKTLLEKLYFFANARAVALFSNLMANVSNSMSNTVVTATIDDDDPNAKGTANSIMSNYLQTRGKKYPYNTLAPADFADWANYGGIQFNINHPDFGTTQVEVTENSIEKKEVSTELEDMLLGYILYTIGVSKESVDAAKTDDYATSVAARSKLFAKRIKTDQDKLAKHISDYVKISVSYDSVTYGAIREVVTNNYADLKKTYLSNEIGSEEAEREDNKEAVIDDIVELLIDDIEFILPSPDVTEDTNQSTQFESFKTNLASVLESMISDETITELGLGELNASKEDIVKMMKFSATIDYLRNNNYMTNVVDMFTLNNDGDAINNPFKDYSIFMKAIANSLIQSKKEIAKDNIEINKENAKAEEIVNNSGSEEDNSGGDDGFGNSNNPSDATEGEVNPFGEEEPTETETPANEEVEPAEETPKENNKEEVPETKEEIVEDNIDNADNAEEEKEVDSTKKDETAETE